MQLPVDVDLSLSDVASEVRDRMSDVIVRHSQNGNLSDGTIPTLNTASSLRGDKTQQRE